MVKELLDWRRNLPPPMRSLEAAAAMLNLSISQLSRIERGERRVAPERVPELEAITGIPRAVFRPDVYGPAPKVLKRRATKER